MQGVKGSGGVSFDLGEEGLGFKVLRFVALVYRVLAVELLGASGPVGLLRALKGLI